jgi:hypothetical protein
MKIFVSNQDFDVENSTQICVIRILCHLEYAAACMNWYAGKWAGREELPPHESIMALSLNLASIGEALHLFYKLVDSGDLSKNESWEPDVLAHWDFLVDDDTRNFKQTLKRLRDKSVFHFDPEPVERYLTNAPIHEESVIYETSSSNPHGFSPLALEIIGNWLFEVGIVNKRAAELSTQIYHHLRELISAYLLELFPSAKPVWE